MKEITFGETLSELLAISNVKVSQLADDLGYDISYISRWLHGTKLPSVKGRSPLFDKISKYLISGCSPEQKSEICRHLDLKTDLPDESLEKEIASALTDGYQSQLEQKKHRGSPIAGMNAHIADERTSYDHHLELLQNAISQACRKPSLLPLEIIASLSVNDFTVDDCVAYFGGLHEICSGNRSINVSILLRKDIFSSPELICPDIIAYCCALPEDIHIDLYLDEEADDQSPTLWVCRDIAVQIAFNLSKQADRYSAISLDPDMISSTYQILKSRKRMKSPLFQQNTLDYLLIHKYFNMFLQNHEFYLLCRKMPSLLQLSKKNSGRKSTSSEIRRTLMDSSQKKKIMIYESAVTDFMINGKLDEFGNELTVSRAERQNYIAELIHMTEKSSDTEIILLNDANPILRSNTMNGMIMLCRENICFTRRMNSVQYCGEASMIASFLQLFQNLCSLASPMAMKREEAAELLTWIKSQNHAS